MSELALMDDSIHNLAKLHQEQQNMTEAQISAEMSEKYVAIYSQNSLGGEALLINAYWWRCLFPKL